jgi:uncharacterized repeat protein (TIGR03803 family)
MQRAECRLTVIAIFAIMTVTLLFAGSATASSTKILHVFDWATYPQANLVRDAAGNLYGTTFDGGGSGCNFGLGCGIVWKLAHNPDGTRTYRILHVFKGADGANPYGGLIFDAAGNLYGTTEFGGANGWGVVFKLKPNCDGTWTERVLYSFTGGAGNPLSGVIFDTAGNLYGTTLSGGDSGWGAVFKLAHSPDGTWTESVLHSFTGGGDGDGAYPEAGLVFDGAGNLYGTTVYGGSAFSDCPWGYASYGCGTVFKLKRNPDGTWTYSVPYSFLGGANGGFPQAGLVFDGAGNLYGTGTPYNTGVPLSPPEGSGGSCAPGATFGACGVVFKLAPNSDGTWTESVLHIFTGGADGADPYAGLTLHAGNLYGTTIFGGCIACDPTGIGYGVVFKLTPTSSGWGETVLHAFLGYGRNPVAGVNFDPAGNLYGTTSNGITYATAGNAIRTYGLVFEITP